MGWGGKGSGGSRREDASPFILPLANIKTDLFIFPLDWWRGVPAHMPQLRASNLTSHVQNQRWGSIPTFILGIKTQF